MLIINRPLLPFFSPDLQLYLLQRRLQFSPAVLHEEDMNDDNQTKTGFYLGRLLSTYETFPAPSFLSSLLFNVIGALKPTGPHSPLICCVNIGSPQ